MAKKTDQNHPYVCPICRSPVDEQQPHFPFCSERCKTMDLAKWAQGDYVISRLIEQTDLDEV